MVSMVPMVPMVSEFTSVPTVLCFIPLSSPRMKLLVDLLQPRLLDVRINLRGRNAAVAQHLLNLPQVSPTRKQVRGETVPQCVRTDRD